MPKAIVVDRRTAGGQAAAVGRVAESLGRGAAARCVLSSDTDPMTQRHDQPSEASRRMDLINRRAWSDRSTVRSLSARQGWTDPGERAALQSVTADASNQPILDLGVGAGRTVPLLREISSDYVGLDYTPELVLACQQRHPGVRILHGDARDLSRFSDGSFQLVVFSFNGIDAVNADDRFTILREARRVLRPGGALLFSSHNRNGPGHGEKLSFGVDRTRNLLKLAERLVVALLHAAQTFRNYENFSKLTYDGDDYSLKNASAHNHGILVHYMSLQAQLSQLDSVGFQPSPLSIPPRAPTVGGFHRGTTRATRGGFTSWCASEGTRSRRVDDVASACAVDGQSSADRDRGPLGECAVSPVVFGPRGKQLLGMYHSPRPGAALGTGVVLCNPFGYEAMCIHRTYRHLATRLAATGFDVLRFDYHGTGDSSGRSDEPDRVRAWTDSVCSAVDELRSIAGVTATNLVGVRLGATLAALAANERGGVRSLVLWAPAVFGPAYVRELRAQQMIAAGSERPVRHPSQGPFAPATLLELSAVNLLRQRGRPAERALIISRDQVQTWEQRLALHLEECGVQTEVRAEAGYARMMDHPETTVVPSATLDSIVTWLRLPEATVAPRRLSYRARPSILTTSGPLPVSLGARGGPVVRGRGPALWHPHGR